MEWIEKLREEQAWAEKVVRRRKLEDYLVFVYVPALLIAGPIGMGIRWAFTGSPT